MSTKNARIQNPYPYNTGAIKPVNEKQEFMARHWNATNTLSWFLWGYPWSNERIAAHFVRGDDINEY